MKRLWVVVVVLVGALARPVHAHERPAERTVIIQAEDHGVAVLVGWREPFGGQRRAAALAAVAGRGEDGAGDALVRTWVSQAVAPLTFRLDGRALALEELEVKVLEDPPGSGHFAVAVLLTAEWTAGRHTLEVETRRDREKTRVQWLDRSRDRDVESRLPAESWFGAGTPLTLEWGDR